MKKFSVIIPVYNEKKNVPLMVKSIRKNLDCEIIFVEDNSEDGTRELLESLNQKEECIKLIKRPERLGVGSAIKKGYEKAVGKVLIFMDADFSHHPKYIKNIIRHVEKNDLVICSRFLKKSFFDQKIRRRIGTCLMQRVMRIITGLKIYDFTNGYLAIKKETAEKIIKKLDELGVDPFITLYQSPLVVTAKKMGFKVKEVPTSYKNREKGDSKVGSVKPSLTALKTVYSITKKIFNPIQISECY